MRKKYQIVLLSMLTTILCSGARAEETLQTMDCKLRRFIPKASKTNYTESDFTEAQQKLLLEFNDQLERVWYCDDGGALSVPRYQDSPYVTLDIVQRMLKSGMANVLKPCCSTDVVIFTSCGHIYLSAKDSDGKLRYRFPEQYEYYEDSTGQLVSKLSTLTKGSDPIWESQARLRPQDSNPLRPIEVFGTFKREMTYYDVEQEIINKPAAQRWRDRLTAITDMAANSVTLFTDQTWVNGVARKATEQERGGAIFDLAFGLIPFGGTASRYQKSSKGVAVLSAVEKAAEIAARTGRTMSTNETVVSAVRGVIGPVLVKGMKGSGGIRLWDDLQDSALKDIGSEKLAEATKVGWAIKRREPRVVVDGMMNLLGKSLENSGLPQITNMGDMFRMNSFAESMLKGQAVKISDTTFPILLGHYKQKQRMAYLGDIYLRPMNDTGILINNWAKRTIYVGEGLLKKQNMSQVIDKVSLDVLVAHEINDLVVTKNTVERILSIRKEPWFQRITLNARTLNWIKGLEAQFPREFETLNYQKFLVFLDDPIFLRSHEVSAIRKLIKRPNGKLGVSTAELIQLRDSGELGPSIYSMSDGLTGKILQNNQAYRNAVDKWVMPLHTSVDVWEYLKEVSSYKEQVLNYKISKTLSNDYVTSYMDDLTYRFDTGGENGLGSYLSGVFRREYNIPTKTQELLFRNNIVAPPEWFVTQ